MNRIASHRIVLAGIAVVLLGGGAALVLVLSGEAPPPDTESIRPPVPGVVRCEEDGLRYTYHVLTGQEALFDARKDPRELRNLLQDHPEEAQRLRRKLESELHVESLDDLRDRRRDEIERLRALGYL